MVIGPPVVIGLQRSLMSLVTGYWATGQLQNGVLGNGPLIFIEVFCVTGPGIYGNGPGILGDGTCI